MKKTRKTEACFGLPHRSTDAAIKFAICCAMLYVVATLLPVYASANLSRHTAAAAALILKLDGFHPVISGTNISQDTFSVRIIPECTALYAGILFCSFVAAFPATPHRKLAGLALGLPVLHVGNALRIALVFAIGMTKPELFQFAHVYLGQIIMMLFVLTVCLAWLRASQPDAGDRLPLVFFVTRFIAFSSIPFILWLHFNGSYVRLTDHVVCWLFSLFNYYLIIADDHAVYYQTFNLVTFAGLVMTGGYRLWRRKWRVIALVLAIVVGLHVMFRICNVLMTAFGITAAYGLSVIVNVVGQYVLPALLWFLIATGPAQARISQDRQ